MLASISGRILRQKSVSWAGGTRPSARARAASCWDASRICCWRASCVASSPGLLDGAARRGDQPLIAAQRGRIVGAERPAVARGQDGEEPERDVRDRFQLGEQRRQQRPLLARAGAVEHQALGKHEKRRRALRQHLAGGAAVRGHEEGIDVAQLLSRGRRACRCAAARHHASDQCRADCLSHPTSAHRIVLLPRSTTKAPRHKALAAFAQTIESELSL
jgi:hypothetical protein